MFSFKNKRYSAMVGHLARQVTAIARRPGSMLWLKMAAESNMFFPRVLSFSRL